jgi:hypothetical protein
MNPLFEKGGATDYDVRLEVFTELKIQVKVFWVVTLCSVVVGYQCSVGS